MQVVSAGTLRRLSLAAPLATLIVACVQGTPALSKESKQANSCPNVDSRLVQLGESTDPASFASQAGLDYTGGLIRVVVELNEGASLPADRGILIEAAQANLVQARLRLDQICPLARGPGVSAIRPPAAAAPQAMPAGRSP